MLWYNIDFVNMRFFKVYVYGCELFIYFLKKREKPYFEGWETLKKKKKVIVVLFIFEIFLGSSIFRKDKTFVLKVM